LSITAVLAAKSPAVVCALCCRYPDECLAEEVQRFDRIGTAKLAVRAIEKVQRQRRQGTDFRFFVYRAMVAQNGGSDEGAIAALAKRMAVVWVVERPSAEKRLRRYLRDGESMGSDDLAELLEELGLVALWRA
jgi:hypothetical protein